MLSLQQPSLGPTLGISNGAAGTGDNDRALAVHFHEQRRTLGKGQAGRTLPAVHLDPLDLLVDAYTQLTAATEQLKSAVTRVRQHQAT